MIFPVTSLNLYSCNYIGKKHFFTNIRYSFEYKKSVYIVYYTQCTIVIELMYDICFCYLVDAKLNVCVCVCLFRSCFCHSRYSPLYSISYDLAHTMESIDVLQFNSQILESSVYCNIK